MVLRLLLGLTFLVNFAKCEDAKVYNVPIMFFKENQQLPFKNELGIRVVGDIALYIYLKCHSACSYPAVSPMWFTDEHNLVRYYGHLSQVHTIVIDIAWCNGYSNGGYSNGGDTKDYYDPKLEADSMTLGGRLFEKSSSAFLRSNHIIFEAKKTPTEGGNTNIPTQQRPESITEILPTPTPIGLSDSDREDTIEDTPADGGNSVSRGSQPAQPDTAEATVGGGNSGSEDKPQPLDFSSFVDEAKQRTRQKRQGHKTRAKRHRPSL